MGGGYAGRREDGAMGGPLPLDQPDSCLVAAWPRATKDGLNDAAWATEDTDLWWYEMACSLDGAKWTSKVYPGRLDDTIAELDVADGNWGVRLCFPRRRL